MKNRINSNSGNLLFYNGVARAVMTGDVELEHFFREDVERLIGSMDAVNADYDGVLIPLANAFRPEYAPILRLLTRFVRATKLPCWVIGVGIQARNEDELRQGFAFDGDARDFVCAVLEKSALLGVRGEYTAAYLQSLGFVPERHFSVIGCPSAYLYGDVLPQLRRKEPEELRRVAVNAAPGLPEAVNELLRRSMADFGEVCFIPQRQRELWLLRYGYECSARSRANAPDYYPLTRRHALYRTGGMAGFVSARSWIDFLAEHADFAFGSRIHGNLAALLAGVPSLLISCDLRTRELARYHGLPFVDGEALRGDEDIRELYAAADFSEPGRRHPENFRRFVAFLEANGIDSIYSDGAPAWGDAPFDRALKELPESPVLRPGMNVPLGERLRSMEMYIQALRRRLKR
ncbi:MAG: polysaccharide pyruvyl transferase family protein [Aristaeellaceae bacterium]